MIKRFIVLLLALCVLVSACTACNFSIFPGPTAGQTDGEPTSEPGLTEDVTEAEPEWSDDAPTEEPQTERVTEFTDLIDFSAETSNGEAFGPADLAGYDLTVINMWATFCGPCIGEMPELAALEKALPGNVRLITFCLDAGSRAESMRQILDDAGFTGVTLVSAEGDLITLSDQAMYVPTTVFVDSSGRMVHEELIGSPENVEETYKAAINEALARMGKGAIQ